MGKDDAVILPSLDAPAKKWVDSHDILADPTDEEIELGNRLGQRIDPDDDGDNGLA
jgi:hypothetical protein